MRSFYTSKFSWQTSSACMHACNKVYQNFRLWALKENINQLISSWGILDWSLYVFISKGHSDRWIDRTYPIDKIIVKFSPPQYFLASQIIRKKVLVIEACGRVWANTTVQLRTGIHRKLYPCVLSAQSRWSGWWEGGGACNASSSSSLTSSSGLAHAPDSFALGDDELLFSVLVGLIVVKAFDGLFGQELDSINKK